MTVANEPMGIRDHEQTYGGFLTLLKWGTVGSFVVAAIVVLIIGS